MKVCQNACVTFTSFIHESSGRIKNVTRMDVKVIFRFLKFLTRENFFCQLRLKCYKYLFVGRGGNFLYQNIYIHLYGFTCTPIFSKLESHVQNYTDLYESHYSVCDRWNGNRCRDPLQLLDWWKRFYIFVSERISFVFTCYDVDISTCDSTAVWKN